MDVGGSRQERVRSANSSLSSCTSLYNCLTVYFKRLTGSMFYDMPLLKTVLDVQQVRLRVFFVRAQHLWRLFSKALEVCVLLRCCEKINPQRIRSGTDAAGSMKKQVCDANLQPKNVQGCTFLGEDVRGSTQKRRFVLCTNLVGRPPKDGRGISQKQVLEQNLSSTDVHGRTSVERYTEVHFWTGYFKRLEDGFKKAGGFFERSFYHGRLL